MANKKPGGCWGINGEGQWCGNPPDTGPFRCFCGNHWPLWNWPYWKKYRFILIGIGLIGSLASIAGLLLVLTYPAESGPAELDPEAVRSKLVSIAEEARAEQIAKAQKLESWELRDRMIEGANQEYEARCKEADRLVTSLFDHPEDMGAVTDEFLRIAIEDGPNEAWRFMSQKRGQILEKASRHAESSRFLARQELRPMLSEASTLRIAGKSKEAMEIFEAVLQIDPTWVDVIVTFGEYLYDQSRSCEFESANIGQAYNLADRMNVLARSSPIQLESNAEVKRLLALSNERLGEILFGRAERGDAEWGVKLIEQSLETRREIWNSNPESDLAARNVTLSLSLLAEKYLERRDEKDSDKALELLLESRSIRKKLYEKNLKSERAIRDYAVVLDDIGKFLIDYPKALDESPENYFHETYTIFEKRNTDAPNEPKTTQDFAICCEHFADYYRDHGQADKSLAKYEKSLQLWSRLSATYPSRSDYALGKSVALRKLAHTLLPRGNLDELEKAKKLLIEANDICRANYENNPRSASATQHYAASLIALGTYYFEMKTPEKAGVAAKYFRTAVAVVEPYYKANRTSARAATEMSFVKSWLGKALMHSDLKEATANIEDAKELTEETLELDPQSIATLRRLSTLAVQLGDCYKKRGLTGDYGLALSEYMLALESRRQILELDTTSLKAAEGVVTALNGVGEAYLRRGNPTDASKAIPYFEESLKFTLKRYQENKESFLAARMLAVSLYWLGTAYQRDQQYVKSWKTTKSCLELLEGLEKQGKALDAQMKEVLESLRRSFGPVTSPQTAN